MTKQAFIDRYTAELVERYIWAKNSDRLARFVDSVRVTLGPTGATTWVSGDAVAATWKALGGKGKLRSATF